ncbi:MAG: LuxR C-terminal-related transcriptional regulator [Ekhidna sp.]
MQGEKRILILVLNDVNDEALLETTMLIDLIHGSDRVLLRKLTPNALYLSDIEDDFLLIFWVSEINDQVECVLRSRSDFNTCLVIYDGGTALNIRKIIHSNVKGIISTNALAELPNALTELGNNGYFICQDTLKMILGKVSTVREEKILSRRELEVLNLLSRGLTYQQVSLKLHISYDTTKTHTYNIYRKLGARNKTEAVHKARVWMILS